MDTVPSVLDTSLFPCTPRREDTFPPVLDIGILGYYGTAMSRNHYDVFFGDQKIHTLVTRDSSKVENWLKSYIANLETNIVGLEIQLLPGSDIVATLQICVCVAGGNNSGGGSSISGCNSSDGGRSSDGCNGSGGGSSSDVGSNSDGGSSSDGCNCSSGSNSKDCCNISGGSSIQCLVYQLIHKARVRKTCKCCHKARVRKTDKFIHKVSTIPQSLFDFLGNPRNIFIGAGTANLADTLTSQFKDLKVGVWFDIVDFVIHEKGVSVLQLPDPAAKLVEAATHLFFENFGNFTLVWQPVWDPWKSSHAWDNKRLTREQVQYACVAAYLPYRIGRLYEVEIAKRLETASCAKSLEESLEAASCAKSLEAASCDKSLEAVSCAKEVTCTRNQEVPFKSYKGNPAPVSGFHSAHVPAPHGPCASPPPRPRPILNNPAYRFFVEKIQQPCTSINAK